MLGGFFGTPKQRDALPIMAPTWPSGHVARGWALPGGADSSRSSVRAGEQPPPGVGNAAADVLLLALDLLVAAEGGDLRQRGLGGVSAHQSQRVRQVPARDALQRRPVTPRQARDPQRVA